MMRKHSDCRPLWTPHSLLAAFILFSSIQIVSAQPEFSAFWNKFMSAATTSDKAALAEMTEFPFSLYGSRIKTKAEFLRRYNEIFNGEANAAQCFRSAKAQKESARRYGVYCPFKGTPDDKENAPIRFIFELTRSGWKFTALDNINE